MKIETNSYFLGFEKKDDGKRRARLVHYVKVYKDGGYTVKDYGIYEDGYDFEYADYNCCSFISECVIPISTKEFKRWTSMATSINDEVLKIAKERNVPMSRAPQSGDWLYYESEVNPKDRYDYPYSEITHLKDDLGDKFKYECMCIGVNGVYVGACYDAISKDDKRISKVMLTNEEAFTLSLELTRKTMQNILDEIEGRIKT